MYEDSTIGKGRPHDLTASSHGPVGAPKGFGWIGDLGDDSVLIAGV